ncbi:acyl-coenzyme A amino acid N-acyltransferase 1-like [Tubulanus polymorphus]|uniref:acyl-coenzyme A amino acid N-acyltransferase 1-like n=1 Tax=Tubulanus polymorphus TaxID=672921 RepID=UPI003DA2B5F9
MIIINDQFKGGKRYRGREIISVICKIVLSVSHVFRILRRHFHQSYSDFSKRLKKLRNSTCKMLIPVRICASFQLGLSGKYTCIREMLSVFRLYHNVAEKAVKRRLRVTPDNDLIDASLKIEADNIKPLENVTLYSEMHEGGFKFGAYSYFVTGPDGTLDLTRDPSVGGSYVGVHPHGLLWGMEPLPGQRPGIRFMKKDVTTPLDINFKMFSDHVAYEDIFNEKPSLIPLGNADIKRWYKSANVERTVIRTGRIRGTFFRPVGTGPFPAAIDIYGTNGGCVEHRSALLASRGIASLALAYFDYEDLHSKVDQLDMNYFIEAVDWLQEQQDVDSRNGIGVVGLSKGAEIALMMTEVCSDITAVVAINPFTHTLFWPTLIGGHIRPGNPIKLAKDFTEGSPFCYKNNAIYPDCDVDDDNRSLIQVEKSDTANFLLIVGQYDLIYHPKSSFNLVKRLRKHGRQNYELLMCPGAGHLLELPHTPVTRYCYFKFLGNVVDYGGEKTLHAKAQENSWNRMLKFLKSKLRNEKETR